MRSKIFQMVEGIIPFDDIEEDHISFAKKWIASGAEIFRVAKPAVPDPHLVAYLLLIDREANKVLLVDHKKCGLWLAAGGHVEINEHPKLAATRELMEELGALPDFIAHDPVFLTVAKTTGIGAGHTDVSLWYILRGSSSRSYKFDLGEFIQIQWFSPEDLPFERADPHLKRCIHKLKHLEVLA